MNFENDKVLSPVFGASTTSGGGPAASFLYEPFYGLREKPFSLSADPRFLFRSPAHGPAFDEILAGIHRREGLIVLTGEIGTGKTTLCRSVLQHLDRRTFAAFVADPFVSREDLLKTLLVDFGVIPISDLARGRFNGASRSDLSYPLYEFLDSLVPLQAFAVLVIDEAQNLSLPLLEEIRILSELERREKLLQVVLVGQPELRSSLRLPEMRQVDQRVSVRCELMALDAYAVAGYVGHRLTVAGRGESGVEFTEPAITAIYEGSSGVPRLINRICDRALQRAHASRTMRIDDRFVRTAIADLGLGAAVLPGGASHGTPVNAIEPAPIADAPGRPAFAVRDLTSVTKDDDALQGLMAFHGEGDAPEPQEAPIERSATRHKWAAVVAGASLVAAASLGAGAWYTRVQASEAQPAVALTPPPTPHIFSPPATMLTLMEPRVESVRAVEASGAEGASVAPTQPPSYSILVASFGSRQRAERLVEELTNAGYGALAVELDGGAHGRLMQVRVSGYTSAIDVQRDLQRIRELPGGYSDARILERE